MPALRLSPDEWLADLGLDGYDAALGERVERLQRRVAEEALDLGLHVILENRFWSRAERAEIRHWARGYGHEVELQLLRPPLDVLAARLAARNQALPRGTYRVTEEDLRTWANPWFEEPAEDELALFDPPFDARA